MMLLSQGRPKTPRAHFKYKDIELARGLGRSRVGCGTCRECALHAVVRGELKPPSVSN